MTGSPSLPAAAPRARRGPLWGTVTLVQERRFQLVDDRGVAHLLLLAPDAPVDPRALGELARSGARVAVSYRDNDSSLVAQVATDIRYSHDNTKDP